MSTSRLWTSWPDQEKAAGPAGWRLTCAPWEVIPGCAWSQPRRRPTVLRRPRWLSCSLEASSKARIIRPAAFSLSMRSLPSTEALVASSCSNSLRACAQWLSPRSCGRPSSSQMAYARWLTQSSRLRLIRKPQRVNTQTPISMRIKVPFGTLGVVTAGCNFAG